MIKKVLFFSLFLYISNLFSYSTFSEKFLFVVVTSYNNAQWVKKNLDSIFSQNYSNYIVIYLDDASQDGTAELVKQYIKKHNLHEKIMLIQNETRQWKMKNLYSLYYMANDWDIIIQVDGDDYLPHPDVFSQINQAYSNNDIWITYGSFIRSKGLEFSGTAKAEFIGELEPTKLIDEDLIDTYGFRRLGWIYVPIRTFYAWLFKLVKLEDCIGMKIPGFESKFFPVSDDQAMMYPMLEMASLEHIFCFPNLMYVANMAPRLHQTTDYNDTTAAACLDEIYSNPSYSKLKKPIERNLSKYFKAKADVLAFCDNAESCISFLASLQNLKGVENVFIVYSSENKNFLEEFIIFKESFWPEIKFFDAQLKNEITQLHNLIQESDIKHILITNTNYYFKNSINLSKCIYTLEKTFAHVFYLTFDLKNKPSTMSYASFEDDICLFKCDQHHPEWIHKIENLSALYRKCDIKWLKQSANLVNNLFKKHNINYKQVSLFFETSKLQKINS